MIANVTIIGKTTKNSIREYRLLEIERVDIYNNKKDVDYIYVTYWNHNSNNILLRLKEGSLVMIVGRLKRDKELGLVIMAERLEYYGEINLTNV